MIRTKFILSGRVQGVGCRVTLLRLILSKHPKTTGYVKNLTDGNVELLIECDESEFSDIHSISQQLRSPIRIDDIKIVEKESCTDRIFHDFKIAH